LYKTVKIFLIVINDFFKDHCLVRASSLTYYFLLSIVPFFAAAFSVLKAFGFQNVYGVILLNRLLINKDVSQQVISYINNTDLKTLGVLGGGFLILVSVFLLSNIEKTFNEIWGIREKRAVIRKFLYYLFAVLVLPLFITIVLSASSDFIANLIALNSDFIFYVFLWLGISLMYIFFTNTKVSIKAAVTGGFIALILWQLAQIGYTAWTRQIQGYNIIYGSFSQAVLVFIWIYINWIVVLIGAETAFSVQNYRTYQKSGKAENVSFSFKEKLSLIVLNIIYKRYKNGEPPLSADEIIEVIRGPIKIINEVLFELTQLNVLEEYYRDEERYFIPAETIDKVTVPFVLKRLRSYGNKNAFIGHHEKFENVDNIINEIFHEVDENYKNYRVADL